MLGQRNGTQLADLMPCSVMENKNIIKLNSRGCTINIRNQNVIWISAFSSGVSILSTSVFKQLLLRLPGTKLPGLGDFRASFLSHFAHSTYLSG